MSRNKTKHVLPVVLGLGLMAVAGQASAHRTYNVYGYAGSLDANFSVDGSDGLWNPALVNSAAQHVVAPLYSGGGGPACGNATAGACPPATAGGSFYRGNVPVSWMSALHATANTPGEVFDLSTADALSITATTPANFKLEVSGNATGTGMDFGYIRVDNAQNAPGYGIKITVAADASLGSTLQPYVALFGGWDQSWTGADGNVATLGTPLASASTPGANRGDAYSYTDGVFGSSLKAIGYEYANTEGALAISFFFKSPASGHYMLAIGGANGTSGAYTYHIETAPVPVPAAVWLLGSALGGLGAFGRRKA